MRIQQTAGDKLTRNWKIPDWSLIYLLKNQIHRRSERRKLKEKDDEFVAIGMEKIDQFEFPTRKN